MKKTIIKLQNHLTKEEFEEMSFSELKDFVINSNIHKECSDAVSYIY